MLRVAFDRQVFDRQRVGGISRYFVALITELRGQPELGVEPVLEFSSTGNVHASTLDGVRYASAPRIARLFDRGVRRDPDVLHFTYYGASEVRRISEVPTVSTLHDMIPELLPTDFPAGNPHEAKSLYLEASTLVISVSQASLDAARELKQPVAHPLVVPLGVSTRQFPFSDEPRTSDVLFVGARSGYKNFTFAAEAFAEARREGRLICLGGGPFTRPEQELLARLGIVGRVLQLEPTDAELSLWYRRSCALLAVSTVEGFGLPVLEAAASGCPVISLGIPAIREVIGEAGLHVDDGDATVAAEMIRSCADGGADIKALRQEALTRARELTWRRTAERTAAAYHLAATAIAQDERWIIPPESRLDE